MKGRRGERGEGETKKSTGHRGRSTGRRAQGSGEEAQGAGHRAQGKKHRAQGKGHRVKERYAECGKRKRTNQETWGRSDKVTYKTARLQDNVISVTPMPYYLVS